MERSICLKCLNETAFKISHVTVSHFEAKITHLWSIRKKQFYFSATTAYVHTNSVTLKFSLVFNCSGKVKLCKVLN